MKYCILIIMLASNVCLSGEIRKNRWFLAPSVGFGSLHIGSEHARDNDNGGLSLSAQLTGGYRLPWGISLELGVSRIVTSDTVERIWEDDAESYSLKESMVFIGYRLPLSNINWVIVPKIGLSEWKVQGSQSSGLNLGSSGRFDALSGQSTRWQLYIELTDRAHFIIQSAKYDFGSKKQLLMGPLVLF